VDKADKETLKADIMTMISNYIKNCSDEEIKDLTATQHL
jgi:hypothetical protein